MCYLIKVEWHQSKLLITYAPLDFFGVQVLLDEVVVVVVHGVRQLQLPAHVGVAVDLQQALYAIRNTR